MAKEKKKKLTDNPAFEYSFPELEGLALAKNQQGRRKLKTMRYWCFRFQSEAEWEAQKNFSDANMKRYERIVEQNKDAPEGLKDYVEALPGFGGWAKFGDTWDLRGSNPFFCVFRLISLWAEWEFVMDRVAVPLTAPPAEVRARMKALEQEYIEKRYDSTH